MVYYRQKTGLVTMSEGSSRQSPASLKPKRDIGKESVQDILEALDEGTETIHALKLLVNENDREGNWELLGQSRRSISNKMKGLKNLKTRIERKMKLKVVEDDEENKGGGGEGGSVDGASRLCADLEEDKGVAKGVDTDDYDEEAAIQRMRKYVKEDDYAYLTPGEDKVNYRKWVRYYKQVGDSEGFDVFDYPGPSLINGNIVPLSIEEDEGTEFYSYLSNLASTALAGVNSNEEASYMFHKLVRANSLVVGGMMFFITFEARNSLRADAIERFQAEIFCPDYTSSEVMLCRRCNDPSVGPVV
ncbi:hypothetical protein ACH5RR_038678 [Cinchona calisaya]|uniref:Cystatin domain-containing protein n=1 Tax=Cinchona calisaya TaxID=153742 RepID=A0ABD2Y1D8_9GENT